MFTTLLTSIRRFAGYVLMLVFAWVCACAPASAQSPLVVSSSAVALPHPSGWGQIWNTAVTSKGDFVVLDWVNYGVYEFPANGSAVITVAAPNQLLSGSKGSYWDMGLGIDVNNRIFTGANYGTEGFFSAPYDPATGTYDQGTYTETGEDAASASYFQSAAITAFPGGGYLVVGDEDGTTGIFTVTYDPVTLKFGTPQYVITGLKKRARSIAVDSAGNIYFFEDGGAPGVLRIPAGMTGISGESSLTRVDPMLGNIQGVTVDAAGNVYIADQSTGVVRVPNVSGTPNTAAAALVTPAQAQGTPSFDQARGILYVPTAGWNGFQDVVKIYLNRAEFGSAAVGGSSASPGTVYYSFSGATTPHSFAIEEAGATSDFAVATGGTCTADTAYAANASCTLNVNLTPHAVGDVSAQLLMLDANGNVLATTLLHGSGQGSAILALPAAESAIGTGLKTPTQVTVDTNGNSYVADAGLGQVLLFPKGSGATTAGTGVGTGLTAPTGVAADRAGDLFIGDSGNVIEVPASQTGLNSAAQVTLKSGLGTHLQLAVDGVGDIFVADPDNQRVVKLSDLGAAGVLGLVETDLTGFSQLSAIAADGSGDLYVANGQNLDEVSTFGVQTTLLSTLNSATGIVVDMSGAVYVAEQGGTVRIPDENGTLTPADQSMVATSVTTPASVATDPQGNVYITDPTAETIHFVSADAFLNFGTLASTTASQSASFTVLNDGNAPLNITGFTGTADFNETSTTCNGPVAPTATCAVTVNFSPGPGDQGNLTGMVLVTGDEANAPVGVNGVGVGAALAQSKTTLSVSNATVDSTTVATTIAPASGTGVQPTGQITLTITGTTLTKPATVTGTLSSGAATLNAPELPAGTYTFTVSYGGDRTYGTSNAAQQVTLAAGGVMIMQPTMAQVQAADPAYPYVLAAGAGAEEPYDGSVTQYEYTYQVTVVTADGSPLIGQPVYLNGKQVATNYGSISFAGVPAGSGCTAIPVAMDGTASFATDCLTINTTNSAIPNILTAYTLTPMYTPAGTGSSAGSTNPNYTAATGTAIAFTGLRNPMVQISSNPSSLSITPGTTTTATLTLSSVLGYGVAGAGGLLNNYSLPVQLACDGLPAYATCSFSYPKPDPSDPNSVDVGPTAGTVLSYMGATAAACTAAQGCVGPGTVIMTINTNVPTGTVAGLRRSSETSFAAMVGFGLLGLIFGRRKSLRERIVTLCCLVICGGILGGISGCSTAQLGSSTTTASPAGTYNVTVTAKQVGSQTITQTPGIVYGNQNQMSLPFTMQVTVQ